MPRKSAVEKTNGAGRKKPAPRNPGWRRWLIGIGVAGLLLAAGLLAAIDIWPSFGAQGADLLRRVIGDQAVAQLEMAVYRVEDEVNLWKFRLGLTTPAVPWVETPAAGAILTPAMTSTPYAPAGLLPTPVAAPPATPASPGGAPPAAWPPGALTPLGSLEGEGIWSSYIQDAAGRTVAYRTYLQPDPARPYVVVGVVAFDLQHTRLHFVLGSVEPYAPNGPKRSGSMPNADRAPGVLLAMFNGGFKGAQGQFGAMADGLIALPPRYNLGTLVIYKDGQVRLGLWGSEIQPSADMAAWRQNGPLVIHGGEINPQVYNDSPQDWGYAADSASATWRSGVGLSADRGTLFYFGGPSLTMEALARSMREAGVADAIQLDINSYWVHFVAVRSGGGKLLLEPLFPKMMKDNIDRYLWPYTRDYFYVTGTP